MRRTVFPLPVTVDQNITQKETLMGNEPYTRIYQGGKGGIKLPVNTFANLCLGDLRPNLDRFRISLISCLLSVVDSLETTTSLCANTIFPSSNVCAGDTRTLLLALFSHSPHRGSNTSSGICESTRRQKRDHFLHGLALR
jgi:hypothetical protein